jgi:hypothetical protein
MIMRTRSCGAGLGLLVLLFVVNPVGNMAALAQCSARDGQCSGQSGPLTIPLDVFMRSMDLDKFEDGLSSLCANDDRCFIRYAKCASDICLGPDKTRDPVDCFPQQFDSYSFIEKKQIASYICAFIKSPSAQTREDLLKYGADDKNRLIENAAFIKALNGSAKSCEDTIKSYVGPYGAKWTLEWYRDLAGCRMLAHQRSRDEEEKDFSTWFGIVRGSGKCADMAEPEMRDACNAPGATPMPAGNI